VCDAFIVQNVQKKDGCTPSEHAIGKVQEHLELLGLNGTRQLPVCADYVTLWLKA
jgi:hypothetical protein